MPSSAGRVFEAARRFAAATDRDSENLEDRAK